MTLPNIFASTPAGAQRPGADLDTNFTAVGLLGMIPCTATGVNAIVLTPITNTAPAIAAYSNYLCFTFVAGSNSTNSVTVQVSGLAALNLYKAGGVTQAGSGDIVANQLYTIIYNLALNSGAGGFVITSSILPSSTTPGFGAQSSIASATTTDLGALTTNNALVTGTTTITSLGSSASTSQPVWLVEFNGALTLTYNATSLILPGGANITTAANDFAYFLYLGSGNWICVGYFTAAVIGRSAEPANFALSASVNANALTVSLTTALGNTPSALSPVTIPFRSATAATGSLTIRTVTASTTIVVASTKTLGTSNSTPFKIWIVVVDTGSGVELGVINCLAGAAPSFSIYPLRADGIISPTATPGNSAQVFYTTSGQTSKPYRVLGYIEYGSGLATAGTWASTPTKIQVFGPDVALPTTAIQVQRNETGAVATGSTQIPLDDTIPQNTEGDQYLSQAITPSSAANILYITHVGYYSSATATRALTAALFQDSTANALAVGYSGETTGTIVNAVPINHMILAGTVSSTTFKIRMGTNGSGTNTFNGASGGRFFGGTFCSHLTIEEIAA